MTLETALFADMKDAFLHGTRKQFKLAQRRYYRYLRTRQK